MVFVSLAEKISKVHGAYLLTAPKETSICNLIVYLYAAREERTFLCRQIINLSTAWS
jgi:hypothetical protein